MNRTEVCPNCSSDIPVSPGYIVWCDKCNWNVNPDVYNYKKGVFDKLWDYLGAKLTTSLFESIIRSDYVIPKITFNRVLAFIIATCVHLTGVFIFYITYKTIFRIHPGISFILLVLGWVALPKIRRIKITPVEKDCTPTLHNIVDTVTQNLNSEKIDIIVISNQYNASFNYSFVKGHLGKKRILEIGIPLFYILEPQERIALIAHEIAHNVNRDVSRGTYINIAMNTLCEWKDFFYGGGILKYIMFIPLFIINLVLYVYGALLFRDSQVSEYYADNLASQVSGAKAQISLLHKLHYQPLYNATLNRVLDYKYASNIFIEFKNRIECMPEREIERIKRAENLNLSRINASHPSTCNRIEYLKKLGVDRPIYILDEETNDALDQELECFTEKINRHFKSYS